MPQSLFQHSLTCCLRRLRLMETQVCGMPTVHAAVTVPAQSDMLLTALTVNGNTSLRYAYRTCRSHYSQHSLGCCLRRLRLMETRVCGMPTVHAAVTAPAQSGMLLTALTVNGNTSLRYAYRTCRSHCPSTVWDAAYGAYG